MDLGRCCQQLEHNMGYLITFDGDKTKQPLSVFVDDSGRVIYNPAQATIIGNAELPEQEWPEPEKQTTGMSWMDKLIDLMP